MGGPRIILSAQVQTLKLLLQPADNVRLASLCGPMSEHLDQVEACFNIEIRNQGHEFQLTGDFASVSNAADVLQNLYRSTESGELSADRVNRVLMTSGEGNGETESELPEQLVLRHARLRAYGENQRRYLAALRDYDLVFGVGHAGTGKTYIAIAQAVHALEQGLIQRIVLVRPVVEAGERLGFLPGDLMQKIDPYLRPMYDALDVLMGHERVAKLMDANTIEICPLAYMRGRTLNDAFVVLDEAQNASRRQMQMFLTRLGFGSRTVVTGDLSQNDLPAGDRSGLDEALEVLEGTPGVAFVRFGLRDVVRHPLVRHVIEAYERRT